MGDTVMKVKAHSKINLTLNVVGQRPDGYHDVDMIMQTLELGDVVTVNKTLSGIEVSGTGSIAYDESNLAYKAAKLFFDVTGIRGGASVYIEKNIPVCAGMAGGSTDCAAVLKCLNAIYGKPLSTKSLIAISARLGADVPYCIAGGTARAQGIGEKLTPLKPFGDVAVVVVKPCISISTPWAYRSLDHDNMDHPDTEAAAEAIERGERNAVYGLMGNSFEKSIFRKYPEIESIKQRLIAFGADGALMSGSGSTVFGIFEDEARAKEAYQYYEGKYKEVFLTRTCNE